MELDNCRIDATLRDSIKEFMWSRRDKRNGTKRGIAFIGREREYKKALGLSEHYFEIIKLKLGPWWDLLDDYTSYKNLECDILCDAEYMRGVSDAFAVFRALLCEDDRRKAAECGLKIQPTLGGEEGGARLC